MKQTIIFALLCTFFFCGCEPNQPKHPDNWSPRGRMYVREHSDFNNATMTDVVWYEVLNFLSTESVIQYQTYNSDFSYHKDLLHVTDTCILKLQYPNFVVKRDVWSDGSHGKFIDINTIEYGSFVYHYVK